MAKGSINVDFSGVEGGGRTRVPEDDYRVRVAKIEQKESRQGNQMLVWDFEIVEGKFGGKKLRDRTTLTKESLWKLKQLLEAMGVSVPSQKVALNYGKYIGKELGVTVVDDEYEGRISSKVSDYISLDVMDNLNGEVTDDEDEDTEPAPKAKKNKKNKKNKKAKAPVDDEEEIEELDLEEM